MTSIVVGYVTTPEGKAALRRAAEEAKLRSATLVVVNSNKGGTALGAVEAADQDRALEEVRSQLRAAFLQRSVDRQIGLAAHRRHQARCCHTDDPLHVALGPQRRLGRLDVADVGLDRDALVHRARLIQKRRDGGFDPVAISIAAQATHLAMPHIAR